MSRQVLPTTPSAARPPAATPSSTPAHGRSAAPRPIPARVAAWLLVLITPLLALVLLLGQRASAGAQAQTAFEAAAALYAAGDPALAQQAYAQLVQQGAGGVALLHNWGAAALRAGDLQTAVGALEGAQRLAPRDSGVAAALATALAAQEAGGILPVSSGARPDRLQQFVDQVSSEWLAPNELALAALAMWVLFAALLLAALLSPRRSVRVVATLASLPVMILLALAVGAIFSIST